MLKVHNSTWRLTATHSTVLPRSARHLPYREVQVSGLLSTAPPSASANGAPSHHQPKATATAAGVTPLSRAGRYQRRPVAYSSSPQTAAAGTICCRRAAASPGAGSTAAAASAA